MHSNLSKPQSSIEPVIEKNMQISLKFS